MDVDLVFIRVVAVAENDGRKAVAEGGSCGITTAKAIVARTIQHAWQLIKVMIRILMSIMWSVLSYSGLFLLR